jgi:diguanylate cyclase (GGDEF)-like protein
MRRDATDRFAVFFMDLDSFKVVNDSMGHLAGDRLLIEVAKRLTSCVREVDTVARLGGDEFVLLLEGLDHNENLQQASDRILNSFSKPFEFDGQQVYTSASMGIVCGTTDYELPSDILRDADIAMYEAKSSGKSRSAVFTPEMRSHTLTRLMMEKDLRIALERQEFSLQYQPILELKTNRIYGFEALLRWKHPTLGMISPGTFIPIAESSGLIVPITEWVINQALQQVSLWQKTYLQHPPLSVSVNLSARLFNSPNLLDHLSRSLAETGVSGNTMIMEITESALISDTDKALNVLNANKTTGVKIHMDDFGTGYSSLSYLHQFPIDAIKIDQTFISAIQPNGEKAEIVRAIVALANDLVLPVIAEGIETQEQFTYIRELGCQMGQGYFISYPLFKEEVERFIVFDSLNTGYLPEH